MAKSNQSDIEFIQALAELLNQNDLGELEVVRQYGESDALEVRVSKTAQIVQAPAAYAPPAAAPAAAAPAPAAEATAPADDTPAALDMNNVETSPIVGTVYLAPEPGSAPFVKIGDQIEEGQTLLIIEAMKTMNQIAATKSGVLKRLLVEDASPVEFGDPLVLIE